MILQDLQVQVTDEIQTMSPVAWNIDLYKESYKTGTVWKTDIIFLIEKADTCLLLSWNNDDSEHCKGGQIKIIRKS